MKEPAEVAPKPTVKKASKSTAKPARRVVVKNDWVSFDQSVKEHMRLFGEAYKAIAKL